MERPALDIVPAAAREEQARHEGTCQMLRDLLAEAEAGTLTGIMAVVERGEENASYVSTGTKDRYALAGRLDALKLSVLGFSADRAAP